LAGNGCRCGHGFTEQAVNGGSGMVRLAQGIESLGSRCAQGALRIQHVEKAEFAKFESLEHGVVGALRARQDVAFERFQFVARGREAPKRLGEIDGEAKLGGPGPKRP
jgi:hypothetical protein